MGLSDGIYELRGTVLATATADILNDEALVTMKCGGCGAEVIINTDNTLQTRCHWCRHTLSLNDKIDNGAVPDGILPFVISKEQAMSAMQTFAGDRSMFQLGDFRASFKPENVMGVYLPYMTMDATTSARLDGVGEKNIVKFVMFETDKEVRYANQFAVVRTMRILVDDVEVTTASAKADIHSTVSTNNIITAVLPFDVKNMVRFDANYLGTQFTAERRDMDVDTADDYAFQHVLTIARAAAKDTIKGYDRGVRWDSEQLEVIGSRWTSVLVPVWLYGFVETRKGVELTHYVAVNGRTGAVMGSIPVDRTKAMWAGVLAGVAALVIGFVTFYLAAFLVILAPFIGWGVYVWITSRYRNRSARYKPERAVAQTVYDIAGQDTFTREIKTKDYRVAGYNDHDPALRAAYVSVVRK